MTTLTYAGHSKRQLHSLRISDPAQGVVWVQLQAYLGINPPGLSCGVVCCNNVVYIWMVERAGALPTPSIQIHTHDQLQITNLLT